MAGHQPGTMYHQLGQLLPKGTLKQFVEQHPEFDIDEQDGRWYIKWRPAAPQRPCPAASGALCASSVSRSEQNRDSFLTAKSFASAEDDASDAFASISGEPCASASEAFASASEEPSDVQDTHGPELRLFPDGRDRSDLSDFWRIGPGRYYPRPF